MWYDRWIKPANINTTFQPNVAVGAARHLELADDTFAGLDYVEWMQFEKDFKYYTGLTYMPFTTDCLIHGLTNPSCSLYRETVGGNNAT